MSTEQSVESLAARLRQVATEKSSSADTNLESSTPTSTSAPTSTQRIRLSLSDRTIIVTRRAGPDGTDRWVVTLRSNGETVSKFGRYDSHDAVVDRVRSLLDAEVQYTVCCDG